jgi:solute carrier family 25 carnitine/acylcarnitine transporter 20/29
MPAFGLYFSLYDICKDIFGDFFVRQARNGEQEAEIDHPHPWIASALAGGVTGATTWTVVYPLDTIKTKIQTGPLDAPVENRRIYTVARKIIQKHGVGHMFRGLNITMLRAFPVNGIIFPVYEYTLMHITALEYN